MPISGVLVAASSSVASSMIALLPETPAKTSACSTIGRIGACVYGFRMEPAPLIRRRQKTCISFACMSGESENSFPSKGALKNREQVVLGPGLKEAAAAGHRPPAQSFSSIVLAPPLPPHLKRFSEFDPADQAFFLLASIMFMMCGALFALLATAIPTLNAMRRAALSLERLADAARQELPGTMAAIRLSGMEISDLTLELSDMSQEISESVRSSARAVHAAEVGIRRMGSLAASQTLSMLQEHASVPVEAVKPVVATAAETTRQAVTQAQKAVLGLAALPVLSKWIQKKNIEEQKKIEEDMGSGSNGGAHEEGSSEGMVDT